MALHFPDFYLMRIGFENKVAELQDLECQIGQPIVHNSTETNIFVGKVTKPKRAVMELKALKVFTEPVEKDEKDIEEVAPPAKKPKVATKSTGDKDFVFIGSDTASEDGLDGDVAVVKNPKAKSASSRAQRWSIPLASAAKNKTDGKETVKVVQLSWVTDSFKAAKILPMEKYVVYTGTRISKLASASKAQPTKLLPAGILSRARADPLSITSLSQTHNHKRGPSYTHGQRPRSQRKRPHLLHESTSEHEEAINLPPLPEYCKKLYSCQRPTPSPTPNDPFIAQLKKIQLARKLISDDIGDRAYNKAIAAIAAYPYTITTPEEILRLPGCGQKYAGLYQEWKATGRIREVDEFESDPKMKVLKLFYGIHGVAGDTANKFYNRGWRELFDIVDKTRPQNWESIKYDQKVGIKYYDEINLKIPREEVERIGSLVLEFANKIRNGFQIVICGGYRRGKKMCGDVDVILTHPDQDATSYLVDKLVLDLAADGWITHKLQESERNSERDQDALEWRGSMKRTGSGFDTLDKALVLWQDQDWPTEEEDLNNDPDAKNPHPHRRVDIIITPWKTAGCAIIGWSGGTMFERDLRSYCRKILGYKFDSSGVRRLDNGAWVDLEGDETDLLVKEKKVFEGLGLDWIEPTLRCTDG